MSLRDILVKHIIDIIDEKVPYRIIRRPYDEDFARAHEIKLSDIQSAQFIPCIECGVDVAPRILIANQKGKSPVYCSSRCRSKHSMNRLVRIDESSNVNEIADKLISKCLTITLEQAVQKSHGQRSATTRALMMQTNTLLAEILKELRDANRTTRATLPVSTKK